MLCLSIPTAISMTLSTRTLLRLCWLPVIFWLHGGLSGAEHVSLRAPVGGESWSAGSVHVIRWDATHIGRNPAVQADFSGDGGTSWNAISTGTLSLSAGTLRWNVPDRVTERCLIRIRNPGSGAVAMNLRPFQITPSQAVPNYQWTNVTHQAPYAPRDGAGALTFQNRMFLLGGWHPGNKQDFPRICNNEVWRSDNGKDWQRIKPNTFLDPTFDPTADWEGRHTGGYVVYRDKMWLVGGDVNQGHYQSDIWNSANGIDWTLVNKDAKPPWGKRALHHTLVFRDKIWLLGGQTMPAFAPSREIFYRDIWTTEDGLRWSPVTPREPYWSARGMIGGSVVFGGRMWILGGGTYDTPQTAERNYYNDVWSSADGVQWKQHLSQAPWPPRQYHHVTVYDGRMWVLAGYRAGDRNDVWYSSDGENWYRQFGTPWQERHAASVFVHDGSLWMAAGSCMRRDVWRLQRSTDPAYTSPAAPEVLVTVNVQLRGIQDKRGYLFDTTHPEGSPVGFQMFQKFPTRVQIYARKFGLNYLDDRGRNTYAEMRVKPNGDIEFVRWRDGGHDDVIQITNATRPRSIHIGAR